MKNNMQPAMCTLATQSHGLAGTAVLLSPALKNSVLENTIVVQNSNLPLLCHGLLSGDQPSVVPEVRFAALPSLCQQFGKFVQLLVEYLTLDI